MAVVAAVIAIMLLRTRTSGAGQPVLAIKTNPKDDFRILCRATMDSLESSPTHRPSVGEQRFQVAQLQRDLVNVARGNSPLAPIALRWIQIQTNAVGSLQEGGEAVVDLLKLWREDGPKSQRNQGPGRQAPRTKDGVKPEVLNGLGSLLRQGFNIKELNSQRAEIHAQLLHFAPQFTGPKDPKASLTVSFQEEEPSAFDKAFGQPHADSSTQRILLFHDSKTTLQHCLVAVRLSHPNGQDRLFCYYVGSWPPGAELRKDYPTGFLGDSDTEVNTVSVTVYSYDASLAPVQIRRRGKAWPYFRP